MNKEPLVAALQGPEPGPVEQLVNAYGDRLLRSAFWLCGNETEAQDIVQDTFLEAIRSAARFQKRSSVYTWLHAILLNVTRHYHRKQKRVVYDNDLADNEAMARDESPNAQDASIAAAALQAALRQLSEAHREVIVLRYYDDLKIHEIASHLGLSPGTVKSRLHYAVGEMQQLLPAEMNLFGASGTEKMHRL